MKKDLKSIKNYFRLLSLSKSITITLIFSYLFSCLTAGTMFVQPGDRATGMGGAFTAVADDATAIYYNPAGLTQLERGVEFTNFYIDSKSTGSKSMQNNPTSTEGNNEFPINSANNYPIYGYQEPSNYNNKNLTVTAYIPFIAGYTKINDINIAFGIYGIGGGTGKWEDTIKSNPPLITGSSIQDDIYASLEKEYSFTVFNFSGAKKISDKVSLGAGLNVIYMQNTVELKKTYTCNTVSALSYNANVKQDCDGYGFEAVGGILYSPIDTLRLGLTLKSGSKIKLEGTATYNQNSTDFNQEYKYPFTYSIGAAYDVSEKLLLSFSADIADYSTMKDDYSYDTQITGVFENKNKNLNWKKTTMLSFGAKYKLNENIDLLAGIRKDPSPYPQYQANLLNTDQYDLVVYTIGASYKINSFKIGFSVVDNISDSLTRDGADYEFNSLGFRSSVSYDF
jgi:long-chain fatty acid transport protein